MRALGIVAGVGLLGLWWSYRTESFKPLNAGACVVVEHTYELESWETEHVYRIELVGKRNYLIRRYPDSLYRDSIGTTWPFSYVKEVPCSQTKGVK